MSFVLLCVSVLLGAVCVATTRAGANGELDPNGLVGVRTPATQASPAAWRAGHAAALPWMWRGALGSVAVAVAGLVVAILDSDDVGLGFGIGSTLVLLVFVVVGGLVGDRAARAVR